jgi:hypothetical protein
MNFNYNAWKEEVEEELYDILKNDSDADHDTLQEELAVRISDECIYYHRCWAIAFTLADPSGWDTFEFGPITSITDLAYATLYEWAFENIDLEQIIEEFNEKKIF